MSKSPVGYPGSDKGVIGNQLSAAACLILRNSEGVNRGWDSSILLISMFGWKPILCVITVFMNLSKVSLYLACRIESHFRGLGNQYSPVIWNISLKMLGAFICVPVLFIAKRWTMISGKWLRTTIIGVCWDERETLNSVQSRNCEQSAELTEPTGAQIKP